MKIKITSLFLIILISSYVSGFGMASSYLEDKTMYLYPGEIRDYKVELQNNDPSEIKIAFNLESEIAEVVDQKESYLVGGETPVQPVIIRLTAPEGALIGNEYHVKYSATPLTESGAPITLNFKFSNEFKVVIGEKPPEPVIEEPKNRNILFPIVFLSIVLVGALVLIFRKNKAFISRMIK